MFYLIYTGLSKIQFPMRFVFDSKHYKTKELQLFYLEAFRNVSSEINI